MSNRSAVLSRKTSVMEWSSISMEQATSKKYGIDYDPIYVFGQGIGQAVGFLEAAGGFRPSGAWGLSMHSMAGLPAAASHWNHGELRGKALASPSATLRVVGHGPRHLSLILPAVRFSHARRERTGLFSAVAFGDWADAHRPFMQSNRG